MPTQNELDNGTGQNVDLHLGVDVGSTTVKLAILDKDDKVVYGIYKRHHTDIRATIAEVLEDAVKSFPRRA